MKIIGLIIGLIIGFYLNDILEKIREIKNKNKSMYSDELKEKHRILANQNETNLNNLSEKELEMTKHWHDRLPEIQQTEEVYHTKQQDNPFKDDPEIKEVLGD